MALHTQDIKPRIATEVRANKQDLLSGEYASDIRELLEQRGVLVFPEINFTDDEQIAFTKTLGKFAPEFDGAEKVHKISLDKRQSQSADYLKGSMYWHLDGTMNAVPILASILTARVLSPTGGQTEFCNTYAAYEDLTAEQKSEVDDLRVMHSAWASMFYYNPEPTDDYMDAMMKIGDAELPMVWHHRSGRKSLVLGCTAYQVLGKEPKESTRILNTLRNWSTQPDFVYRHEWNIGDTVIWDNTGTMHRALPYDPSSGRMMHRTKLQGEEPIE